MIKEVMENGIYKSIDGDRVLLTIESLENNVYKAKNDFMEITAEVIPLNDYETKMKCIEYKKADKNGRYRKSTTLLNHYMKWLDYILEEKGFIRRKKCVE